ncbi:unnamed protein product, partial [Effrenium voratum]
EILDMWKRCRQDPTSWKQVPRAGLKEYATKKVKDKPKEGNAVPKSDDEKNWRKAAFSRELSPIEALLLGDGAGSEWDFEWSGGKFPVKFKADGYNHFQCDEFPAHAPLAQPDTAV